MKNKYYLLANAVTQLFLLVQYEEMTSNLTTVRKILQEFLFPFDKINAALNNSFVIKK